MKKYQARLCMKRNQARLRLNKSGMMRRGIWQKKFGFLPKMQQYPDSDSLFPPRSLAKNELQRIYQKRKCTTLPVYSVRTTGPSHNMTFYVSVSLKDLAQFKPQEELQAALAASLAKFENPAQVADVEFGYFLIGYGEGKKKKDAENDAALDALKKLALMGVGAPDDDESVSGQLEKLISAAGNPKVTLNEVYMKKFKHNPEYKISSVVNGFKATVKIEGKEYSGIGLSKAKCTRAAAQAALNGFGTDW
eukprot:TRINITY_DN10348_c0_g1_i3.p1 TRINITY_DN10348_c0_g1~~TRINITY_DN10348_c0_g1_i3.p1  ORF type:complete len:249 (-),score=48.36 TRINITY_DN10348_c0_g1_i3:310-1056(-)